MCIIQLRADQAYKFHPSMSVFVDDKEMAEDRHVASKQRGVMRQLRLLPPVHQQKHDHHAAQHERDVEHALLGQKRDKCPTSAFLHCRRRIPISVSGVTH